MKFTNLNVTVLPDSKICTETLLGQKGYTTPAQLKVIIDTGNLKITNNLSDVLDDAVARVNLGLGTSSTMNFGTGPNELVQLTSTGKLPAVDGSLLTGIVVPASGLQPANNLSDLVNISTAKTNLGLGSAANRDDLYFEKSLGAPPFDNYVLGSNTSGVRFWLSPAAAGASEPLLGNPSSSGYILSSTISGTRSWVPQASAGEQALGNPTVNGSFLVSTTSGVRSWSDPSTLNFASKSLNLSDLSSASQARTNLGLGTAATQPTTAFEAGLLNPSVSGYVLSSTSAGVRSWVAQSSGPAGSLLATNNLSDVSNTVTARFNLGLGTAATQASTAFEATLLNPSVSGYVLSSTTAGVRSWVAQSSGSAGALLATNNLSDVSNTSTARTNLGLGTAATQPSTAFEATLSNPSVSGQVLSSTTAGIKSWVSLSSSGLLPANNLSDVSNVTTSRTNLGLGTAATQPTTFFEANLANPATNGFILSSTTAGVRSWIAPSAGGSLVNFTESISNTGINTPRNVVMLRATGAATDIDITLSPKGAGAVSAHLADGGLSGGNKRGINSVDLQTIRSSATQVASGGYSTISGGSANTASATTSTVGGGSSNNASVSNSTIAGGSNNISSSTGASVAGGSNNTSSGANSFSVGSSCTASGSASSALGSTNTASGANSTAIGNSNSIGGFGSVGIGINNFTSSSGNVALGESNTVTGLNATAIGFTNTANSTYSFSSGSRSSSKTVYAAKVHSSGTFAIVGDAQKGLYVLRRSTADATPSSLFLDGSSETLKISDNSVYSFSGMVAARSSTGVSAGWRYTGTIKRGAGVASTVLVGMVVGTPDMDAGAVGWTLAITANVTTGSLDIQVTGAAATSIRWVATCETAEVSF